MNKRAADTRKPAARYQSRPFRLQPVLLPWRDTSKTKAESGLQVSICFPFGLGCGPTVPRTRPGRRFQVEERT